MEVLAVASEIFPIIKTGGLADIVGALPAALAAHGIRVRTLVPGYPEIMTAIGSPDAIQAIPEVFGGSGRLLAGRVGNTDLLVLDAPQFFARTGNPYTAPGGEPWPDNAFRFAALARIGAAVGRGLLAGYVPDIVHAHDWQAGLVPAYLHYAGGKRPGTVMTIHNLAFQGQFPRQLLSALGLPAQSYVFDGVEYYGSVGYLKAGLQFADRITTVSPGYAAEIRSDAGGMGMQGLLRARSGVVTGILNGIDTAEWNPATDRRIATPFSARRMAGRIANKADLQARFGLDADLQTLVFGVVSRLSAQKGLDLLLDALPTLLAAGGQLALLGSGDAALEAAFLDAAIGHRGRVGVVIGYDEAMAHRIQAGADALLVPSRFEPCGLTQLYALRYGTVPVVARVGGLADTVIDANPMALAAGVATGVQFAPVDADRLRTAIGHTATLFADPPTWRKIQANGMGCDVSWEGPARRYAALFRDLVAARAA